MVWATHSLLEQCIYSSPKYRLARASCVDPEAAASTLKDIIFTDCRVSSLSTTLHIPSSYSADRQVCICYTKSLLQVQLIILGNSAIPPDNTTVIYSLD